MFRLMKGYWALDSQLGLRVLHFGLGLRFGGLWCNVSGSALHLLACMLN